MFRLFIPPIIYVLVKRILGKRRSIWTGNYSSWDEAQSASKGYQADDILDKCKTSLLKVKNGEAVYERDSVLFDHVQYSWPLLAGLMRAALEFGGELSVLDFGGSLGSTYFQNRAFLTGIRNFKWAIVEQNNFVSCGKKYFEDETLRFYYTVEEAVQENRPNVLVLSSVLQYLDEPYKWVEKFVGLGVPYIILDRTAFTNAGLDRITIQNVPNDIYNATYPAWFFSTRLTDAFQTEYDVLEKFDNGFTPPTTLDTGESAFWNGIIFRKKR